MGQTGSFTSKVTLRPEIFVFTQWQNLELRQFLLRGKRDLAETYALRKHEFDYLLGCDHSSFIPSSAHTGLPSTTSLAVALSNKEDSIGNLPSTRHAYSTSSTVRASSITFKHARNLFTDVFDTDNNGLVDKLEVMAVAALSSHVSSEEKISFLFDLCHLDSKGYLNEAELVLLVKAVTRGVFKIDQKFSPPNDREVRDLVTDALSFARITPNTLRRPELLQFVLQNATASAYLECWRGHSSQVLLPPKQKWRDVHFPANESSITPTIQWLDYGLPPGEFVRWRRLAKIETGLGGCIQLFAHIVSFLKTVDRRRVYIGQGALGAGHIKQGYLSDLWFLNALAMLSARPDLLYSTFAATGQEEKGRICTRFYEGGKWRSVYVDDRIPCDADGEPLFARSSCVVESWIMLLEKGFAKYLGSYGHLSRCGMRGDSILMALRLLTGGHAIQYSVADFEWKSMQSEIIGESGLQIIRHILAEGGLVALGRSAVMANLTRPTLDRNADDDSDDEDPNFLPPCSRLFAVVAVVEDKGFQYLVLRDAWGLISDSEGDKIDSESGHCNTFRVAVEEVNIMYDVMITLRFPDGLRLNAASHGLKPWYTDVKSTPTFGKAKPAHFLLTVSPPPEDTHENIAQRFHKTRSEKQREVHEALMKAEATGEDDGLRGLRLKDKREFSRNREGTQEKRKIALRGKMDAIFQNRQTPEGLTEVCLSLSSSCDWVISGSDEVASQIRVRIVARSDTRRAILERDQTIREKQKRDEDLLRSRHQGPSEFIPPSSLQTDPANTDFKFMSFNSYSESTQDLSRYCEIEYSAHRMWVSRSFFLLPGEYDVYTDISFSVPFMYAKISSLPRDLEESPWVDPVVIRLASTSPALSKFHPTRPENDGYIREGEDLQSVELLEKKLFPNLQRTGEVAAEDEEELSLDHYVWGEASSHAKVTLTSMTSSIGTVKANETSHHDVLDKFDETSAISGPTDFSDSVQLPVEEQSQFADYCAEETWPFVAETQHEVSSRMLYAQMADLNDYAHEVGEQLLEIADYRRKEQIRLHRSQPQN